VFENIKKDQGVPFLIELGVKCSLDFKIECIQFVMVSKHANESVKKW
jgi:hypothetical protein